MNYEIELDEHIEDAIDRYRWARDRAMREVENGELALNFSRQVAKAVLQASRELVVPGGFEYQQAWETLRDMAKADLVQEDLRILLASELIPNTVAMANRCVDISREVLYREPNESVRRFVRRLTRCFIAGYLPECVMLCRAVLENAVTEVVTALQLRPEPNKDGFVGMSSRLDALRAVGRLSEETRTDAGVVWKRGNTAVHKDPEAVQEVAATIDLTLRILGDLYKHPLPTAGVPSPDA